MEFIASVAIIVVICVILNVPFDVMLAGAVIIVWLILALMMLLFVYFFTRMLFSKRKEAEFSRIDKPENWKFKVAYYIVDGVEYPCIFPEEGVMSSKLYKKGKKYHVRLNKRMKRVYDRFACATCTLGFFISILLALATVELFIVGDIFNISEFLK